MCGGYTGEYDAMVTVIKTSPVTGEQNGMDIACTEDQYMSYLRGDGLIQDLLPEATVDQREFLISGCTPTCWKSMFGEAVV
tara:strand:- start:14932 stop:15174 length:243 start_codon:yes stop_codon:yes gene_type:complete